MVVAVTVEGVSGVFTEEDQLLSLFGGRIIEGDRVTIDGFGFPIVDGYRDPVELYNDGHELRVHYELV